MLTRQCPRVLTHKLLFSVVDHTKWLMRPLSKLQLSYAASDVHLIESVYEYFCRQNYIDSTIGEQSMRYVSIWKDARPSRKDIYRGNPLLPLQIIGYRPSDCVKTCTGCTRALPLHCFEIAEGGQGAEMKSKCWVCEAVSVWSSYGHLCPGLRRRYGARKLQVARGITNVGRRRRDADWFLCL